MKKISKKISCTLVLLAILVSSFFMGFESKASNTYYVDYAQPSTSDNQGYLLLEVQRTDGTRFADVFFWSANAMSNLDGTSTLLTSMNINIQSNSNVVFTPVVPSTYSYGYCTISYFNGDGQVVKLSSGNNLSSYTFSAYASNGWKVVGWQYQGNIGTFTSSISWVGSSFDVVFNSNESAKKLQSIYEQLLISNSNDIQMINKLNSIMNSTLSIDDKLSYLIELQEENNTWLQKIWTSIQRLFKGDNVEDDAKVDDFGNTTTQQSDKISDLQEQNKVEKVDTDSASSSVDSNIDAEEIGNFGTVLTVFTGDTHILQYILVVLSVALISYVLFGKR